MLKSVKSPPPPPVAAASVGVTAVASPLIGAKFTMPIPQGVNVMGFTSSPKLLSRPVVDAGTLTWDLGVTVAPNKQVKIGLKLQPTNCTTPAPLALNGQFAFTDAFGARTVDVCLKKPVSGVE